MERFRYRAWHKERKQMYDVKSLIFDTASKMIGVVCWTFRKTTYFEGDEFKPDEIELMQCTGLRATVADGKYFVFNNPNEGKLIFDGDIISISAYSYTEPEADYFGVVTVGAYGYGLFDEYSEAKLLYFNDIQGSYITHYEVLGNIFEHGELLESTEH